MHYVYIYLDPRKPGFFSYGETISFLYEPFYVGKGKGNRAESHLRETTWRHNVSYRNNIKVNKIKKIIETGMIPFILMVDYGSETDMLIREEELINCIGRSIDNSGPLTNIRKTTWPSPDRKNNRSSTYPRNRPSQITITDGYQTIRVFSDEKQHYLSRGFTEISWSRQKAQNQKSRTGDKNGMFGKSANLGKRWVSLPDGTSLLLTNTEIGELSVPFEFGRKVSKNQRKRVIIKGDIQSKYMSDDEISRLPKGTKYQFGLMWKESNKTFTTGE